MFCKTLALAAGVATIVVGTTWYLNPAVRRWRRPRLHARRALPPPRCAASVEKMTGPEQQQQEAAGTRREAYQLDVLPATAVGPKRTRSVMSAVMDTKPESPATVHAGDAPVHAHLGGTHLLELPVDLLVLILASLPPAQCHAIRTSTPCGKCCCSSCTTASAVRVLCGTGQCRPLLDKDDTRIVPCCTARHGTVGKALALAGACCKTFANVVAEAATVVAGDYGWRLPMTDGDCTQDTMRVRFLVVSLLSKLEQETMRVRFCVRAMSWRSEPYVGYVHFWTIHGLSLALLSAPSLYIDAQVRRQHTLELGALLFRAAMDAWRHNWSSSRACTQLLTVMAHPGTPLDASWLAARVIPYIENHLLDIGTMSYKNSRRVGMVKLLSHLKPHAFRYHPEILEWLQRSLQLFG